MSNFPFNAHKYNTGDAVNGSPLTYNQAWKLAREVRYWHSEIANTDDWSESNDGAELDIRCLALGLIELLSDPGAVRRLVMAGSYVHESIRLLMDTTITTPPYVDAKLVVEKLFE